MRRSILFLPAILFFSSLFSQANTYILNGAAVQNTCNCYTLTPAVNTQSGSVWNANKINLNNPFDFVFNVYLGCLDANGADGIVFILQPISTSVGTTGEGMGFQGISPSIGISLDTWQNANRNDPVYDHISIQANGNITHGVDLAGPVQATSASENIEDCQWHTFRVVWDPVNKRITTYFDGEFRLQSNIDLVTTIFNNDPMVYWGFTAGTGGANNLQQFCTALNPGFSSNFTSNTTCFGNPVVFTNTSASFAPIASFHWDFGDGNTSSLANPPPHNYTQPGIYEVKLAITALDGCNSDTSRKTIIVGDYPMANFDVYDTCAGFAPRIIDRSTATVGNISQWNWLLDGNPASVSQIPQLGVLTPGPHQLKLDVKTNHGCASTQVTRSFVVKPVPLIDAISSNGCAGKPLPMSALQLDNATTVNNWQWTFGNNKTSTLQNPTATYNAAGNYTVAVYAVATNGCHSNTVSLPVTIHSVTAHAGNDTVIIKDTPFTMQSSYVQSGSVIPVFTWSPAINLDNPSLLQPITILTDDQVYYFTVTTPEGCIAKDTIHITVFKGGSIFVPTGFTPNGNGLNETLQPFFAGIKSLDYFSIYNRWGERVFTTRTQGQGWDGKIRGALQPTAPMYGCYGQLIMEESSTS